MARLQWDEPRGYRRAQNRMVGRGDRLKTLGYAGFCFVMLLALRGLAGIHPAPDAHPPGWGITLLVAVVGAFMIAFVVPAIMNYAATAVVILSEKGINHNVVWGRGLRVGFWAWDTLGECKIGHDTAEGRTYRVLHIIDQNGDEVKTIAIPDSISDVRVQEALARRTQY